MYVKIAQTVCYNLVWEGGAHLCKYWRIFSSDAAMQIFLLSFPLPSPLPVIGTSRESGALSYLGSTGEKRAQSTKWWHGMMRRRRLRRQGPYCPQA